MHGNHGVYRRGIPTDAAISLQLSGLLQTHKLFATRTFYFYVVINSSEIIYYRSACLTFFVLIISCF